MSSVAWGSITGTLSNQTDLKNALAAKAQARTDGPIGVKETQGSREATIALNSGATNMFYSYVAAPPPIGYNNRTIVTTATVKANSGTMTFKMKVQKIGGSNPPSVERQFTVGTDPQTVTIYTSLVMPWYSGSNYDPNPGVFFTHVSGSNGQILRTTQDVVDHPREIRAGPDFEPITYNMLFIIAKVTDYPGAGIRNMSSTAVSAGYWLANEFVTWMPIFTDGWVNFNVTVQESTEPVTAWVMPQGFPSVPMYRHKFDTTGYDIFAMVTDPDHTSPGYLGAGGGGYLWVKASTLYRSTLFHEFYHNLDDELRVNQGYPNMPMCSEGSAPHCYPAYGYSGQTDDWFHDSFTGRVAGNLGATREAWLNIPTFKTWID